MTQLTFRTGSESPRASRSEVETIGAPRPRGGSVPGVERRGPVLPLSPRELVRSLADRAASWQSLVRFCEPRFSTRLAAGPQWEAWLLCWLPGQATGLHDHGGSSGAFAVLSGALDETVPGRRTDAAGAVTRPGPRSRRYRAGEVRSFGSAHVHDVAALSGRRAVSLHVYAPGLTEMTRYRLGDGGALVVTSRERAGQDW